MLFVPLLGGGFGDFLVGLGILFTLPEAEKQRDKGRRTGTLLVYAQGVKAFSSVVHSTPGSVCTECSISASAGWFEQSPRAFPQAHLSQSQPRGRQLCEPRAVPHHALLAWAPQICSQVWAGSLEHPTKQGREPGAPNCPWCGSGQVPQEMWDGPTEYGGECAPRPCGGEHVPTALTRCVER